MVNWSEFHQLSGSPQYNFEVLCRSIIRLQFGKYGQLAALANQPGVEFHLSLHTKCNLGKEGNWFGWQCRFYDLPNRKVLGPARRKQIKEAITKTEEYLPGITDWVLWTRHVLTKTDQNWFYALKTKMRLHLWDANEVNTYLTGDAEILRRTFFGDLVLTTEVLAAQHKLSIARIGKRWLPEVHQAVETERKIRQMLAEAVSWKELCSISDSLEIARKRITKESVKFPQRILELTLAFLQVTVNVGRLLKEIHGLIQRGDFDLLRERLAARPLGYGPEINAVPRALRAGRFAAALYAANALADLGLAVQLLSQIDGCLGERLIAVVADAGGGKTQLAAELTAPTPDRPAGILLFGRELHSGRGLDDLAKMVIIQGTPVPSMDALLAALDAAGKRANRRIPIVIDGLNEAEDPRDWKPQLATLTTQLKGFSNVLTICTIRTGARLPMEHEWMGSPRLDMIPPARMDFAMQALPDGVEQLLIPDFGQDTMEAIQKYFTYFKINVGDAELPFELIGHPLTLRIFCEVTNRDRQKEVTIEGMPGSLTDLFDKYIDHAIERIGELAPRSHRYCEQDVRRAVNLIGNELWSKRSRELPERKTREIIGDAARPWNDSIVHLLEQEGLILRIPSGTPGEQAIIPVYDALGGHITATSVIANSGLSQLGNWLREPATVSALDGGHPLAFDIFRSLVGLVPRWLHQQQLWQLLDEPLRSAALRVAAGLEGKYLDAATVKELGDYISKNKPNTDRLLSRLRIVRGIPNHPLNAEFLDLLLRPMFAGERDLLWTEWIRQNHDEVQNDVLDLEAKWRSHLGRRSISDYLRTRWLLWVLTTTVRNLRDRATRALYWFGRGDPNSLFKLTHAAAEINDPYVFERVMAANYGVAMALYSICDRKDPLLRVLSENARNIYQLLFEHNAPARTTHELTREYGSRLVELTAFHNKKVFTENELSQARPPYTAGGKIAWEDLVTEGEERLPHPNSPFRLDFSNYTLGRLVDGRENYDFNNPAYEKVRSQVLSRVKQLGWSPERFAAIDTIIEKRRSDYGRVVDEYGKIDRYGKKYSMIAYLELKGFLHDSKALKRREDFGRIWDVDIDPSFPAEAPEYRLITDDFLGKPNLSHMAWIRNGPTPNLKRYSEVPKILDEVGPWILLHGFFAQQDETRGRRIFVQVRSFLIASQDAESLCNLWKKHNAARDRWLEPPSYVYAFAGEFPWCNTIPKANRQILNFKLRERNATVNDVQEMAWLDGKALNLTRMQIARLKIFGEIDLPETGNSGLTDADFARITYRRHRVKVEKIITEYKTHKALMPVCEFGWEKRNVDNVHIQGVTLIKQIAQAFCLRNIPQTLDLQTIDGLRATYGVAFKPRDQDNSQRFFLIRKHILEEILERSKKRLVLFICGERQLSLKQFERVRSNRDFADPIYGDFHTVTLF